MMSRYLSIFAALCVCAPAFSETDKPEEKLTPPVWTVTDDDSVIHIVGALYVTPKNKDWRSAAITRAIDAADTVWFEVESDTEEAKQSARRVLMTDGFISSEKTLSGILGKRDAAKLEEIADDVGLPLTVIDRMKPWHAYLVLAIQLFADQGFEPGGVENSLMQEARTRGRQMRYLETVEDQLGVFKSMTDKTATDTLRYLLNSWDEQRRAFPLLVGSWGDGHIEDLDAFQNAPMRKGAPGAYELLVKNRSKAWAEEIEAALSGEGDVLFVIAAGNLAGPGSVIDLLAQRNIEAIRVVEPASDSDGEEDAVSDASAEEETDDPIAELLNDF